MSANRTLMIEDNWKYRAWLAQGWSGSTIDDYIGYEIYPEDLQMMTPILLPKLILYHDCVLAAGAGTEKDIAGAKKRFDYWCSNGGKIAGQCMANAIELVDCFLATAEKSSAETLQSVAALIRHCWQYQLLQEYPQRRFTVAISGETFAPEITFWQDEGDDGEQTGYEY